MTYCDPTEKVGVDPRDNFRAVGIVSRLDPRWKELSKKRPIIERFFRSAKHSRLLDRHQYLRMNKIEMHANLSYLTYLATMLTHVRAGDLARIRHMNFGIK